MSKDTILLTGCAGFIGGHVAEALLERGEYVIGVDNFDPYYDPEFKRTNIDHIQKGDKYKRFQFVEGDITDPEFVTSVHNEHGPFVNILHLAAKAGVRASFDDPIAYQKTNIIGTANIIQIAIKDKVKSLTIASSSSVYGNNEKIPFAETDPVEEPISPYAASKKAVELLAYTYSKSHDLNINCLRFFTVYGPRNRPDMAAYKFAKAILNGDTIQKFGDGSTSRDYTYVKDIVAGIIAAMENPDGYQIYNLGNSHPITLNEFIDTIAKVCGKKAKIETKPIPQGDVEKTYADISKAKKKLGYNPKTNLEQGMTALVDWMKTK